MALKLRTMGITRVRPLLGGFAEWKRRGYPLEDALERIGWRSTVTSP
jgi:3-mercaptopyruvate sulfurtransferase SseA